MPVDGRHTVAEEDRYRDELKARSHVAREDYYGSGNTAQTSLAREDQVLTALAASENEDFSEVVEDIEVTVEEELGMSMRGAAHGDAIGGRIELMDTGNVARRKLVMTETVSSPPTCSSISTFPTCFAQVRPSHISGGSRFGSLLFCCPVVAVGLTRPHNQTILRSQFERAPNESMRTDRARPGLAVASPHLRPARPSPYLAAPRPPACPVLPPSHVSASIRAATTTATWTCWRRMRRPTACSRPRLARPIGPQRAIGPSPP